MVFKMGDQNGDYTEKLISLIKVRPALYDKTLLGYTDRPLKRKLWFEICELMTPGWMHHSLSEKLEIEAKVQKNWLQIKSSFEKELSQQKIVRLLGARVNKQNRYAYFDKLQFLMPTINVSSPPSSSRQGQNVKSTSVNNRPSYFIPASTNSHSSTLASGNVQNNKKKRLNKEPYVKILNIQSNKEIDEDKHFLLSLIPSLQKMSSTQKMRAKMKFLQAIHDIEVETQLTPPCPQSVEKELGYNQPSQFASQPTPCTITSDSISDQSDPPSMIQSSPRLMQNSPSLIQNSPMLIQRSPSRSPAPQQTNERQMPTVWVKDNSVLLAQPPPRQNSPRIIQSSPSPEPQQTNENQLSAVWIKDKSVILSQPPQQTLNSFKDEIIIED